MTDSKTVAMLNEDNRREIGSFDDALAAMAAAKVDVVTTTDLGDGFSVLETKDKAKLVDVKFVIIDSKFHEGDQGEFVSLWIVTEHGQKLIVNDGSTGIYAQMKRYHGAGRTAGIICEKGLVRSDYVHPEHGPATTYYLP